MYNDHHGDPKIMAVVDRWPLFRGFSECGKQDAKIVVIIDKWSLFGGGCWLRFDCIVLLSLNLPCDVDLEVKCIQLCFSLRANCVRLILHN